MSYTAYVIYIQLYKAACQWWVTGEQAERGPEGRGHQVALWHALCQHTGRVNCPSLVSASHLIDVHAVVTCQRAGRRQVVGAEESGDDAVLVHLSDCGAINKINQAILVYGDACWHQVRGRREEKGGGGLVITGKQGRYAASLLAWLSGQNTMDTCVKLAFPLFRSLQKAQPSIIHGLLFWY